MEWQREGFEMFSKMMTSISADFVRYVMHVQMAEPPQNDRPEGSDGQGLVGVTEQKQAVAAGTPNAQIASTTAPLVKPNQAPSRTPVVKSELERVGRNEPCPCGSGKKFKMCHGRTAARATL